MDYIFNMEENEYWWGGTSVDGNILPFDNSTEFTRDFTAGCPNQTMPMYLSSHGRCIWSEEPFKISVINGVIQIQGDDVVLEKFGGTLREAYLGAMHKYFPPAGNNPPEDFFIKPQYNTWMQMTYNPTQDKVLEYAKNIIANGFEPGILIIDEGWQKFYGEWDFDRLKFPDPKKMVDELHSMGFMVMLWVVPCVRPDGEFFARHISKSFNPDSYDKLFLRNERGEIAISKWWNGLSATLDFTKECDCKFLDEQLQTLINNYKIDGFKFDGGTVTRYSDDSAVNGPLDKSYSPAQRNIAWNDFGARYKYHEYKDTFKGGGKRVIQRIRDRNHSWDGEGLNTLVPNAIAQGLLGHPFICPDMIGGGEWTYIALNRPVDEELFVRMAQCSALFPMMQFSWAPWEAVSSENLEVIKQAMKLHVEFKDEILKLVNEACVDGEPILRSLEYNYPHKGYHKINDIFMLGKNILAAPVLKKGAVSRTVTLPEGQWADYSGKTYKGGITIEIPVSIDTLPFYIRK